MKREDVKRDVRTSRIGVTLLVLVTFHVSPFSSSAAAQPTQADVFRSIQQNVGQRSDESSKGLGLLLCGAGGILLALVVGSRLRRRQSAPKALDHPGKLLREVMKTVPLRPREMKQLKLLADASREGGEADAVQSPLTFLLCPSVLAKALKDRPAKVDRTVIADVVRKLGHARAVQ